MRLENANSITLFSPALVSHPTSYYYASAKLNQLQCGLSGTISVVSETYLALKHSTRPQYVEYLRALSKSDAESASSLSVDASDAFKNLLQRSNSFHWTTESVSCIFRGLEDFKDYSQFQDAPELPAHTVRAALGYFTLITNALGFREMRQLNPLLGRLFLKHGEAVVHWLRILLSFKSYPVAVIDDLTPASLYLTFTMAAHAVQHISCEFVTDRDAWFSSSFMELLISKLWRCELGLGLVRERTRCNAYSVIFRDTNTECICPCLWMIVHIFQAGRRDPSCAIHKTLVETLEADPNLIHIILEGVQKKAKNLDERKKDDFEPGTILGDVLALTDIMAGLRSLAQGSPALKEHVVWGRKLSDIVHGVSGVLAYLIDQRNSVNLAAEVMGDIVHPLMLEVMNDDWVVSFPDRTRLACVVLKMTERTAEATVLRPSNRPGLSWLEEHWRWQGLTLHAIVARSMVKVTSEPLVQPSTPFPLVYSGTEVWNRTHNQIRMLLFVRAVVKGTRYDICDNASVSSILAEFHVLSLTLFVVVSVERPVRSDLLKYAQTACKSRTAPASARGRIGTLCIEKSVRLSASILNVRTFPYNIARTLILTSSTSIVRNAMGLPYSIKDRATHMKFLENNFDGHVAQCKECQSNAPPVLSIDFTGLNHNTSHHSHSVETGWEREGVAFTQEVLKPRFLANFQGDHVRAQQRRMMEMVIPFTSRTHVYLTVVFQRMVSKEGELFARVLYGIARFGTVTLGGPVDPQGGGHLARLRAEPRP